MFTTLLLIAIFLAWLAPFLGDGPVLSRAAQIGVSVIFFFYGLKLNWTKIYEGLANYRLHIVVHLATFVLFPLLILPLVYLFGQTEETRLLWLGVFFLATLPSTVSSSVIMVNIARGNVPAAIFDASISSMVGVFLTPLWMQIFIAGQAGSRELSQVLVLLVVQVLVPIAMGVFLHRFWGTFAERHSKLLGKFDQAVILLIVYTSFCHSFTEEMFSGLSWSTLLLQIVGLSLLFFLVYGILRGVCWLLGFNRADTITTLFCGSKKSLVHGTVMSQVLLSDPRLSGILILPTMIYHAMQLLFVGVLAKSWAKSAEPEEPK